VATIVSECRVCGDLGAVEYGSQKGGRPEEDTFIPPAMERLERVADLGTDGSREHTLLQCPECGRWFRYDTDYEFIVPGTEDSQTLRGIGEDEAKVLLAGHGQ
jgi:hypothetical protein